MEEGESESQASGAPSKLVLRVVLAVLAVLVAMSYTAEFFWSGLVDTHPLLLITLSARSRYLALVTNQLGTFEYYTVGLVRLLVSDPLFYFLGFWYGNRAIAWMQRRLPSMGDALHTIEESFGILSYPLVFAIPNNYICLFAGSARMRPSVFLFLNVTGTVGRLYLIRRLGERYKDSIDNIMDFIADYRWWILGVSIGIGVLTLARDWRKGNSELQGLSDLHDELSD